MIRFFLPISELMLATLIERYYKKSFHFKSKRLTEMSNATFYDCINTIYQYIKPFFLKIKCPFLRNMEPLKQEI